MGQTRSIEERLRVLDPTIQQLMGIAGTAGLALGVYRKDELPYYANFGFRDVNHQLPPTEQTIFPICSQTKMLTALAMALLVDDPEIKVTWDTPVKDILPELAIKDA